jgi:PAS domain S-box-containing protein
MPDKQAAALERELAAVYENIPGIVFYIAVEPDGEFRFVSMSNAGLAATGLSRERFVGARVRDVIPPASRDLVLNNYREAIRSGRTVRWKEVSEYPAGRKIGEVAVTPLVDESGATTHLIGIVHDVTEQEQLADALRAVREAAHDRELARRAVQLSRLASDLTLAEQHTREQIAKTLHDGLQQLLVTAALDLDRRIERNAQQGTPDDLLLQVKGHIDDAVAAARSLSFDLFPPVLHTSGLPAALRWLANQMRNKYGIVVEVSADPLANSGRKDVRTLLFESVRELLFNAVKHAHVERVIVRLTLEPHDALRIVVEDSGPGFDPLEAVERANSAQAGWGLFSIRERLTLLGGAFDIDSAPGQGARFSLTAPGAAAQEAAAENGLPSRRPAEPLTSPTAVPAPARALRILIVDDHAQIRKVLRALLEERRELQVVGEASDGVEAIAQAHALAPDVILMDVSMPNMDGVQATRRIHAELPAIEILGISMQPRGEERHPIEDAGAAGFFMKGVDTRSLVARLIAMQKLRYGLRSTTAGSSLTIR